MRSPPGITGKASSVKPIPVLLVDDDVDLCSSLTRLLSMDGFSVNAVYDGDSGVRHALNFRIADVASLRRSIYRPWQV
jgi:DNA-binding NtrC family response regulator